MKCPICKNENLDSSKKKGYYFCPGCRAYILTTIDDDPELNLHKYKGEMFNCRALDVDKAFAKAKAKFDNSKFEVVAVIPSRTGKKSLLFGYPFICMKRKRKSK